jgi:hypothetical protein
MDGKVQSITTIFIISYEVESIAKLLQFATTCSGLIGHHQVVNTSCVDLPLLQEVFAT